MEYLVLLIIGFIISSVFFRVFFLETKNKTEKIMWFLFELFILYNYFMVWNEFDIQHNWLIDILYYLAIPIITYVLNNKLKDIV